MKTVTLKRARSRTTMCLLGTTLVLLLFSFALFGQGNFGRILGRVTDPTGAVLPGATINILDTQRGLARTLTTNNSRPDETVWMVDGIINANFVDYRPIANMPSPFTDGATILPIDAIQEFHLEENPRAEYGWKTGAIVNVGIRSGTNTFHGSGYAFGRDGSWAARNVFNPSPHPALPTELEQFGGVVGGPIKTDK